MTETELLAEILLITTAAFLGAVVARLLHLPTIIGFLAAGLLLGPETPGPVGDVEIVTKVADVGVVMLMFSIGAEFSFEEFGAQPRTVFLGGACQILATLVMGTLMGNLLGLSTQAAIVLGFLTAISSTVVAVRLLESAGQIRSPAGTSTVYVLILQDIAAVFMVLALPSLKGETPDVTSILIGLAKGILLVGLTYGLSKRVLPGLWRWIVHGRSRELSLLGTLILAVGLATGSGVLGLSIAFGAFLAGLAISESAYGRTALQDVLPLREVFASMFFVSIGMLIEPKTLTEQPMMVISILLFVVVGKGILASLSLRLAGLEMEHALKSGLVLAQVGEFSFVMASSALHNGVIDDDLASAFLMAAVLSILVSPGLLRSGPLLLAGLRRVPLLRDELSRPPAHLGGPTNLRRHVVICGYGATATPIVATLSGRSLPFVIIDNNPFVFDRVRRSDGDMPFIYGDATQPQVLELAALGDARMLVVTIPSASEAQVVITQAIAINPGLDIVTRGSQAAGVMVLRRSGATEVVDPEFEASLELLRHILHGFGISGTAIGAIQASWRGRHYG